MFSLDKLDEDFMNSIKSLSTKELQSNLIENTQRMEYNYVINILKEIKIDPSFDYNSLLSVACINTVTNKSIKFIHYLLNDHRVAKNFNESTLLASACEAGRTEIVEIFLNYEHCIPTYNNHSSLIWALFKCHYDIVELFNKHVEEYNIPVDRSKGNSIDLVIDSYQDKKLREPILDFMAYHYRDELYNDIKKQLEISIVKSNVNNF